MAEEVDENQLIQAYQYWHDTDFDEGFDEGYDLGYCDGWDAAVASGTVEESPSEGR